MIRRLVTLVLAGGLALIMAVPAQAATVTTSIVSRTVGFDPAITKGAMGSTFAWKNNDPTFTHTSTQNIPLGLWDTGSIVPGITKSTVIAYAGSYAYHCNFHPTMTGTVKVPVIVSPASGTTSTTFTIKLATKAPPSPYVYDVQKKVGSGAWANYRVGVTTITVAFHPLATGTFSFRSRLRNTSTAASSGYSPAKTITVS